MKGEAGRARGWNGHHALVIGYHQRNEQHFEHFNAYPNHAPAHFRTTSPSSLPHLSSAGLPDPAVRMIKPYTYYFAIVFGLHLRQ